MRLTRQRKAILQHLQRRFDHPTAEMIHEGIRFDMEDVSLATVYRSLGLLNSAGLIQELPDQGRGKRYDGNPLPHHHFFCEQCGSVEDLFAGLPGTLRESLSRIAHGEVRQIQVLLKGTCDECKTREEERGSEQ
ncbi:MAG: transcriptional repressor [Candidatus Krumholzibacteria bacterium]|nr:transcriptional repressor [Candidatus Krumholzibacteria bacterium]